MRAHPFSPALLVVGLFCALSACGSRGGTAAGGGDAITGDEPGAHAPGSIAWLGRRREMDPADPAHVRLSWPGVGLAVRFFGTGVSAEMRDDVRAYNGKQLASYWDVVVDGGAPTTFHLSTDKQAIALAAGLPAGEHELWLRKRTEASLGATEIFSLTVQGGALTAPPTLPSRRVEVVGASIETGYGVEGTEGVDCDGFSAAQQNQGKAWPQLLADAFGAQLMNTSYSGKGLSNNIDISLDPVNTMPVVARLAEPTDFGHAWDPNAWVPDVVAIAMGANDWEGAGAATFDPNRLARGYVAFVLERLAQAPSATFYATVSPQIYAQERQDVSLAVHQAVDSLRAQGHTRVHYLEFPEYGGQAKSCDGHPPPFLHQQMANQVAQQIRLDVGW